MKFMKLCLLSMLLMSLGICSCSSDDEEESSLCTGMTKLETKATLNGESLSLSIAQLSISDVFGSDNYTFQIGTLSDDCTTSRVVSFFIEIPGGSELGGSYPYVDFFDAGVNNATGGGYTVQSFQPISQSLTEFNGGTFAITNHGDKDFTIDINATLVGGGTVTFNTRHQF